MTIQKISKAVRARGIAKGYLSGLEEAVAADLQSKGVAAEYEPIKITFKQPAKSRKYTPDFVLPSGIIIETKGRFVTADRQKHLMIRESNPQLDIRFVFSNSKTKISKRSKTTYAMWCKKNGFKYADKRVPDSWIREGVDTDGIQRQGKEEDLR